MNCLQWSPAQIFSLTRKSYGPKSFVTYVFELVSVGIETIYIWWNSLKCAMCIFIAALRPERTRKSQRRLDTSWDRPSQILCLIFNIHESMTTSHSRLSSDSLQGAVSDENFKWTRTSELTLSWVLEYMKADRKFRNILFRSYFVLT